MSLVTCLVEEGCICDKLATKNQEWEHRQDLEKAWLSLLSSCWCINLKTRNDRYIETCNELHRAGLCRIVRFYRPDPVTVDDLKLMGLKSTDSPGYFGCWQSHRAVCKLAFTENPKGRTLVLEDDVQFNHEYLSVETLSSMASYLNRTKSAEVFHLGHVAIFGGFPIELIDQSLTIMRVRSSLMHAYIMTPNGLAKFLKDGVFGSQGHVCVDMWLLWNLRQEAVFPQFATQRSSPSSNLNGPALTERPPSAGAPHLELYARYHMLVDIFFCWIAPNAVIVALVLAFAALLFRRLEFCLWILLLGIIVILVGAICLGVRGRGAAGRKKREEVVSDGRPPPALSMS